MKVPPNTACSVHPNPDKVRRGRGGGSRRGFMQFAWLEVGSVKVAFSRLAHQRVPITAPVKDPKNK